MTEEKKTYREGDEPELKAVEVPEVTEPAGIPGETVGTVTDEHEDKVKDAIIPITAFIVIKLPSRVEVVLDMPGLAMDHRPSMQEIRDMAMSAHDDAQAAIFASKGAITFTQAIAKAAEAKQSPAQANIIRPVGVVGTPPGRLPR